MAVKADITITTDYMEQSDLYVPVQTVATEGKVTAAEINEYFGSAPDKLLEIMRGQTRRLRELTADYEEVCKTIAEWKAKDDDGEQKGGLMGALKKFAAIFNESMKYMGSSSAGLYYSPTTIAML